jgi:hypothetical protein
VKADAAAGDGACEQCHGGRQAAPDRCPPLWPGDSSAMAARAPWLP